MIDRGKHPQGHERARVNVANARSGRIPGSIGIAGNVGKATHALRNDVVGGPIRIGTCAGSRVAEAANGTVDDAWIALLDDVIANAQLVHHANAHVLDNRISLLTERQQRLPVSLELQIQNNTAFVPINAGKVAAIVDARRLLG